MELFSSFIERLVQVSRPIHFRGKTRLLSHIGPCRGVRCATIFNVNFELDLEDHIQRQIYLGVFEPHETAIVRSHLRPGMTVFDVGANIGYYSALAATLIGKEGRVYAFEPSPYAFARLNSMVHSNHLTQVTVNQCGLSETPGILNLYLGRNSDNHTPTMIEHPNTTATAVPVDTLDHVAERFGVEQIDLLKIDVEGFEPKVLAGARQLLAGKRIRAILCEFNEHWLNRIASSPEQLEQTLRRAGLNELYRYLDNRYFALS